jgi:hypothetical protein
MKSNEKNITEERLLNIIKMEKYASLLGSMFDISRF